MKKVQCQECGGCFALKETVTAKGKCLCQECIEKAVAAEEMTWEEVERNIDATVCAQCGKDNGDAVFELLAGVGVCPKCTAWLRNRPWPEWTKPALALIVIVVIAATMWNWRFVDAYLDVKAAQSALAKGDFAEAALLAESASRSVPESQQVLILMHYVRGMDLFRRDRQAEAYSEFCHCCEADPTVEGFRAMRAHAAIGKAFEERNYDEFMRLTLELAKQWGESEASGMLASAYACKYATTRDEQYKAKVMEYLAKTKEIWRADDRETYEEFEDRMIHRMETGEIVKLAEFKERYPKGYRAREEKI